MTLGYSFCAGFGFAAGFVTSVLLGIAIFATVAILIEWLYQWLTDPYR